MAIRAGILLAQLVLASCQIFTQLAPVPGDAGQARAAAPTQKSEVVSTADELAAAIQDIDVTVVRVNGAPSGLTESRAARAWCSRAPPCCGQARVCFSTSASACAWLRACHGTPLATHTSGASQQGPPRRPHNAGRRRLAARPADAQHEPPRAADVWCARSPARGGAALPLNLLVFPRGPVEGSPHSRVRQGHWCAVGPEMATVDCAGAYNALGVEGELTLRNVLLRGIAPSSEARINTRTQLQLSHCDLWPSFVVMPGAQARPPRSPHWAPQAVVWCAHPGSAVTAEREGSDSGSVPQPACGPGPAHMLGGWTAGGCLDQQAGMQVKHQLRQAKAARGPRQSTQPGLQSRKRRPSSGVPRLSCACR